MKLKFVEQIQAVIDAIALLPNEVDTVAELKIPFNLIAKVDADARNQKDKNLLPVTKWVKIRSQLSFIYKVGNYAHALDPNVISECFIQNSAEKNIDNQQDHYTFLVKSIKRIKSNRALENEAFVKIALEYGVIYLSNFEVSNLIRSNVVK